MHQGGVEWELQLAEHQTDRPDEHLFGRCDLTRGQIALNPDMSEDLTRETLLHEVLHACFFASGGFPETEPVTEEQIILMVSPVLVEVLRQNPSLVTYLRRR